MGTLRSSLNASKNQPSTFALLVDDINKMSESEQKLLWLQINQEKLTTLAKAIDDSAVAHNFSDSEIDAMINEAAEMANRSNLESNPRIRKIIICLSLH